MIDSEVFVEAIIYDEDGNLQTPNPMDDLYYQIQSLVYLYQNNPEWPEDFKRDIMDYVQRCTDLLQKM